MNRRLRVSVSKDPPTEGVMMCRNLTIRERILNLLLGDKRRITVLIPGKDVDEIAICETERGKNDGKDETIA